MYFVLYYWESLVFVLIIVIISLWYLFCIINILIVLSLEVWNDLILFKNCISILCILILIRRLNKVFDFFNGYEILL